MEKSHSTKDVKDKINSRNTSAKKEQYKKKENANEEKPNKDKSNKENKEKKPSLYTLLNVDPKATKEEIVS